MLITNYEFQITNGNLSMGRPKMNIKRAQQTRKLSEMLDWRFHASQFRIFVENKSST
jgi:hypothetical protein